MIVRIVQGRVAANKEGLFHELVRQQTLPALRAQPGFVYGKFARRIDDDGEHFLLVSEWRDATSLYGWAGPDITKPKLMSVDAELIADYSVQHYEALDILPDDGRLWPVASDLRPDDEEGTEEPAARAEAGESP